MKKDKKSNEKERDLGGRPSLWVNPEVLKKLVDEFFEHETQPTLAGLANSLNIARSTLYEYNKKDGFSDILKGARRKVEASYEKKLVYGTQPTGVIFALKNMGWRDKQDIDHTSKGRRLDVTVVSYLDDKKKK